MFERFTDHARKVIALSNQEAQRFSDEYIGTEHILLGLIKLGSGTGYKVLTSFDVDLKELQRRLGERIAEGQRDIVHTSEAQTPRAKKVIEYSIEEAREIGSKLNLKKYYVGTGHILLGLLREKEGIAGQVLTDLGLELERVRFTVFRIVREEGPEEAHIEGRQARPLDDRVPLTLLIDPGDAKAEELSELFVELSTLYRMLGGSGINFTIIDAREPAVA